MALTYNFKIFYYYGTGANDYILDEQSLSASGLPVRITSKGPTYSKTGYYLIDWKRRTPFTYNTSWSDTSISAPTYVDPEETFVISKDANQYSTYIGVCYDAEWGIRTYNVAYNANGGSGAPSAQTKTYGTNLTLSSTVPTRTGYNFKGWATSSTGSVAYAAGGTYKENAAITLYAVWEEKTATLTYNFNGGTAASGQKTSATMKYTTAYTIQTGTPTKTGHSFGGWNTNSSGTGTNYSAGATYKNANTVPTAATLYAKWTANTYTVSYNANSGSGAPSAQTKTYGVTLKLSTTKPTRTGYTFKTWNTKADGTGTNYASGANYTANAAATLYAIWTPNPSTITSASNATIGSATSIKWTPANSAFVYKLKFSLGSWSATTDFISPNATTAYTYSYTVPMTVCNQLPSATSGTMTVVLYSYTSSSASAMGTTSSKTFTITVPSSVVPTISSVTLSEGTESGFSVYATTLSTIQAVIATGGSYSATVKTAKLEVDGQTITGNVSSNSCTLTTAKLKTAKTNASVKVTITDSRGRTATSTQTVNIYAYSAPNVSNISFDISGSSVNLTVKGSIASVNNLNNKYITITRKKLSTGATTTVQSKTTLSAYSFTYNKTETIEDVDTESYLYTVTLQDSKQTKSFTKSTGVVALSLLAGGNGVAVGKEADTANLFDVNLPARFRQNVQFDDGHTVNKFISSISAGSAITVQVPSDYKGLFMSTGLSEGSLNSGLFIVHCQTGGVFLDAINMGHLLVVERASTASPYLMTIRNNGPYSCYISHIGIGEVVKQSTVTNGTVLLNYRDLNHLGIGNYTHNLWDNSEDVHLLSRRFNGGIFRISCTEGTEGTDYPVGLPVALRNRTAIVYRQQLLQTSGTLNHAIVKLYEVYPTPGRVWTDTYNTSWIGWQSHLGSDSTIYTTCTTAADTAAKVASIQGDSTFYLRTGAMITVKYTNTNTASNPTLNVNGTGAKSIWYNQAVVTTGSLNTAGRANTYITYMYDGTYWVFVSWGLDSNTTYSTLTQDLINTGTETTGKLVTAKEMSDTAAQATAYGTCTTAASEQVKVVTISTPWKLRTGCVIGVRFTNTNTYSATSSAPCQLNVNSTGAKNIWYANSSAPTGTNTTAFGRATYINFYMYNGGQWVWCGSSADNNTTYSSQAAASGGTAVSLVTTGEKYTWNNKASTAVATTSANGLMAASDKTKLNAVNTNGYYGSATYNVTQNRDVTLIAIKVATAGAYLIHSFVKTNVSVNVIYTSQIAVSGVTQTVRQSGVNGGGICNMMFANLAANAEIQINVYHGHSAAVQFYGNVYALRLNNSNISWTNSVVG